MSLINNMLKNLQKNEEPPALQPPWVLLKTPRWPHQWQIIKILGMGILAFSLAAILYRSLLPSVHEHDIAMPTSRELARATEQIFVKNEENNSENRWLDEVAIKGITVDIKRDETELTFLLDHPVLYRLDLYRNTFIVDLAQAKLESQLPLIKASTALIQNLTASNEKGNTRFTFTLMPNTVLKSAYLDTHGVQTEMVIAFEQTQETSHAEANVANGMIKTTSLESAVIAKYEDALGMAEEGQVEMAMDILSDLLITYPDYHDARVSLIALCLNKNELEKAGKLINEGLEQNQQYLPFVELKAQWLSRQGKLHEALSVLGRYTPDMQLYPDYYELTAALYERANQAALAANLYKKLLKIDPRKGNWWFGLGLALDKLGNRKAARQAYSHAVEEGELPAASLAYSENRLRG